jgi:hypothetical protein
MKCKNCHSQWNTDYDKSKTWTECPVCGKSLAGDAAPAGEPPFDNSGDALAHIMRKHGIDVLLGDNLKAWFTDVAPEVSGGVKRVVLSVHGVGAAQILNGNHSSGQSEKEIAVKRAVAKLTNEGFDKNLSDKIIREFTDALGWKIGLQAPKPAASLTVGQRNVKFGKYNWRVLDVRDGKALLLTEGIIEKRVYNVERADITWEECTLRQYLNGKFLQTFSGAEQGRILKTNNINADNQRFGTGGGNNTVDRVFLLSIEETVRYFGDSGQLQNSNPSSRLWIDDQYNKERMAKHGNGELAWWWLRSPGYSGNYAASVFDVGGIRIRGLGVYGVSGGVRPALWLNL